MPLLTIQNFQNFIMISMLFQSQRRIQIVFDHENSQSLVFFSTIIHTWQNFGQRWSLYGLVGFSLLVRRIEYWISFSKALLITLETIKSTIINNRQSESFKSSLIDIMVNQSCLSVTIEIKRNHRAARAYKINLPNQSTKLMIFLLWCLFISIWVLHYTLFCIVLSDKTVKNVISRREARIINIKSRRCSKTNP